MYTGPDAEVSCAAVWGYDSGVSSDVTATSSFWQEVNIKAPVSTLNIPINIFFMSLNFSFKMIR